MGDELAQRLPVAVVRCGDDTQRERLEASARANRVLYVPVVTPPTTTGLHVLEVYVPGDPSPTLLLGEPLGPPTAHGSPFRLRMMTPVGSSSRLTSVGRAPHRSGATPTQAAHATLPAHATQPAADAHDDHARDDDAFVGRTLAAGKLRIEARVGEGGAGTVYRARHRDLEMDVAVKVMHDSFQRDPEFCRRFHAEALSASRLDHTNLTRVLDFGQEPDGLLYIAMEFLDGRTLRDLLERENRMDFQRAAQLMTQVCSGLTHAHARSIIHRDIKPENLVLVRGLDDDGRETEIVKVCDFGIAHRSAVETEAIFAGTAEYIAPELFRGDPPDVQSDVYACGVVLYELLTGRVPIEGDVPAIVPRVLQDTPDPPSVHAPGIDPRVDRLVMKALAKNREVRQASVRELRADIRTLAEEIAVFSSGGYWDDQPASIPVARPAQASQANETNDWLEHGPGYLEAMTRSMSAAPPVDVAPARFSTPAARPSPPPASFRPTMPVPERGASVRPSRASVPDVESGGIMRGSHVSMTPAAADASDSARAIAPFLQRLADTRDKARFASLVAPLGPRIRELVEQGNAGAAWRLCSTLELIAREPPGPQSRATEAQQIVDVFVDPQTLAVCAEKALDGVADKDGYAKKLVARAGHRGAHALYSARLKSGVFEARERFVALLTEMGRDGLAVVRAALEHLEPRLSVPGATAVAEDILRAIAEIPDEALGQILARYAKSPNATLALHATNALPRTWGGRARPLLLAQIHHRDEEVAIAAMKRLRELCRVDREILTQLRPLVLGAGGARPKVRLAATDALTDVTPEARPAAEELLAQALDATQGSTPDVEDMVVMIASTIVTIGGDVALVAARWRTSTTWLRTRLEAVMRRARQR